MVCRILVQLLCLCSCQERGAEFNPSAASSVASTKARGDTDKNLQCSSWYWPFSVFWEIIPSCLCLEMLLSGPKSASALVDSVVEDNRKQLTVYEFPVYYVILIFFKWCFFLFGLLFFEKQIAMSWLTTGL